MADLLLVLTKDSFCSVTCGAVPRRVKLHTVPEENEGWNMSHPVLQAPVAD